MIYFFESFLVAPFQALFPVYIEADLARPPWFTGYLRGIMLLLGGIFAVVAGRLCDRFGRKTTLMIGLVGSALTGLVFRTADPWGLSCLLLAMGAASGPWSTAGQSILITAVTPARLGLGGALYFLSNTLGNALGSFCTGLVKTAYSFAQIGAVMSIGMVAVVALALALLPGDAPSSTTAQTARLNTWTAYRPLLGRGNVHLLLSLRLTITTFWGMATLALPLLIYRVGESESLPAFLPPFRWWRRPAASSASAISTTASAARHRSSARRPESSSAPWDWPCGTIPSSVSLPAGLLSRLRRGPSRR